MLIKNSIFTFFLYTILCQPLNLNAEKEWDQVVHYATKPSSLFIVGLTSLGAYTFFSSTTEKNVTFDWFQNLWQAAPTLVKYSTAFLGGWFVYYNLYTYQKKTVTTAPLESKELQDYIRTYALRFNNIENILEIKILAKNKIHKNRIDIICEKLDELQKKSEVISDTQDLLVKQVNNLEREKDHSIKQVDTSKDEVKETETDSLINRIKILEDRMDILLPQ